MASILTTAENIPKDSLFLKNDDLKDRCSCMRKKMKVFSIAIILRRCILRI